MKKNSLRNKQTKKDFQKQHLQKKKQVRNNSFSNLLGLTIIIILGIIIYSNSFKCSFVFDDFKNIVNNKMIQNLSDVNAWWSFSFNRPVSMFTIALNYHFNHLDVWYYHLFNLLIHLINACLVWWLTLLIFSSPSLKDDSIIKYKNIIAFITALLFVSHPLATQSVTYIVQRMTSMAAMFYLLSLTLYVKARLLNKKNIFIFLLFFGSLISAILAFLTKENAYTLPFAIILFEIFFLIKKKISIDLKDYRLILLFAIFISVIVYFLFKFSLNIFNTIQPSNGNNYSLSPYNYLLTQFSVIVKYIQLLFLPINQNLDYDFPISNNFLEIRTLLCFLLLLSLIILAIYLFKRNRIISFGIFWFFLTLSIESSFIPINDVIYEHRTYLPSFGFFLSLTSGIYILLWEKYKYIAITLFGIIIISNSFLTYNRNNIWMNNMTLWNDAVLKSPHKARPINNRGFSYFNLGQFEKAKDDFTKSININPNYTIAYFNRGFTYLKLEQWENAIADFTKAIAINPEFSPAYSNRGQAYDKHSQFSMAIEDYSKSIALNPKYVEGYFNRGMDYISIEQYEKAITDFKSAIEIYPEFSPAYYGCGLTYSKQNLFNNAIVEYTKAIEINPQYVEAFSNRGIAYFNIGQWDKAIDDLTIVIKINPKSFQAYNNRGVTYEKHELLNKAIEDYSSAIEINPKYTTGLFNRGSVYLKLGKWENAITDFSRVIEIDPTYTDAHKYIDIAYNNLKSKQK